jgi:uncharacterized protein (TIGR02145 family)
MRTVKTIFSFLKQAGYQFHTPLVINVSILILASGCSNSNTTATDIQGNIYNTEIVNGTVWMVENLRVTSFQNGDSIPEALTNEEWVNAGDNKKPAWCYNEYNQRMYNWFAVSDSRGLAVYGYRIPTSTDYDELINQVESESTAVTFLSSFERHNLFGSERLQSCFTGYRYFNGDFYFSEEYTYSQYGFWCLDEYDESFAYSCFINENDSSAYIDMFSNYTGFYVRCVKDTIIEEIAL